MFNFVSTEWTLKNDVELCAYLEQFQKSFCDKCDEMENSCRKLNENSEKAINSIRNLEVKLTSMTNRKFVDMKILEDNDVLIRRRNNFNNAVEVDTMENVLNALTEAARSGIETTRKRIEVSEDLPPFIGSQSFNSKKYFIKVDEDVPCPVTPLENKEEPTAVVHIPQVSKPVIEKETTAEVREIIHSPKESFVPPIVVDEANDETPPKIVEDPISVFNPVPKIVAEVPKINSTFNPVIPDVIPSTSNTTAEDSSKPAEDPPLPSVEEKPFADRLEHLFQSRLKNVTPKLEVVTKKAVEDEVDNLSTKNQVVEVVSDELNREKVEASSNAHDLPVPKSRQSNFVNTIIEKEKPKSRKKGLFDSDSDEEEVFHEFSKVLQKIKTSGTPEQEKPVIPQAYVAPKATPSVPKENISTSPEHTTPIDSHSDNFIAVAKSRTKGPSRKPPARTIKVEKEKDTHRAEEQPSQTKEPINKQNELVDQVAAPKSTGKSQPVKSIFDSESDDDLFTSSSSSGKKESTTQKAVEEPAHSKTKDMAPRKQTRQAVKNIFESDSEDDLALFRKKH